MKSITIETETSTAKLGISDTDGITINGTPIGGGSGENTEYDSSNSSTSATTVQDALEAAFSRIDMLESKGSWVFVDVGEDFDASKNHFVRMTAGLTVNLPSAPEDGVRVGVMDVNGLADSESFIVSGNGNNIYGETEIAMNIKYFSEIYQYIDSIGEWRIESTPVTDN